MSRFWDMGSNELKLTICHPVDKPEGVVKAKDGVRLR